MGPSRSMGLSGTQGECLLSYVFASHSALGSDTTPLPSWAALHLSTWGSLKQALKGLSVEFALLADKAAQQVSALALHAPVPGCSVPCGCAGPPQPSFKGPTSSGGATISGNCLFLSAVGGSPPSGLFFGEGYQ